MNILDSIKSFVLRKLGWNVPPLPARPPAVAEVSPACPWVALDDGVDLVVRNVTATCFGGKYDDGDDGQTESGLLNDGSDPDLLGVALPIRSTEAATRGSPLAFTGQHIPWKTLVLVWREVDGEGSAITCLLIDNGPDVSKYPTHAIDLNPNVVLKHFAPNFDPRKVANEWSETGISYRILGGAKYICAIQNEPVAAAVPTPTAGNQKVAGA